MMQKIESKQIEEQIKESPEEFYKTVFCHEFDRRRIYDDMCFALEELCECPDAELEAFEEIVCKNVKSTWRKGLAAAFLVPIVGWMFGIAFFINYFTDKGNSQYDEYHYLKYRKIARKKGISLALVIREYAAEKRKKESYDISDACTL